MLNLGPIGYWWAATPRNEWPLDDDATREVLKQWQEPWGDRRTELVLIGQQLDREGLIQALDACLLTEAEMTQGPKKWRYRNDPFANWAQADLAGV